MNQNIDILKKLPLHPIMKRTLVLVMDGQNRDEVAAMLNISPRQLSRRVRSMCKTMGVRTEGQLVQKIISLGHRTKDKSALPIGRFN